MNSPGSRMQRFAAGSVVFALAFAAFLWGVDTAKDIYFDENWYVPTARAWLATGEMLHQEHPPLGKLLIAASMWLFGDNPWGWRGLSALFGALTILGVWLWTLALIGDLVAATWTAAITGFDQIVFVQARIGMLDIFLMAFSVWALALFTLAIKDSRPARAFASALGMGVCLGFAGACKWSGFFLAAGLLAIVLLIALLRLWKVRFDDAKPGDFYDPESARAWSVGRVALGFGVAPFLAYALTYAPQMIHEGSLHEFVASHRRMLDIMSGVSAGHPYQSLWYTWPALWRPVWYLFEIKGHDVALWTDNNPAQAIVGLPNPVVFFAGEAATLYALANALIRREREALIVAVGFFSQYLPWAVNPKGLEFFYYFYPSILCMGPALALFFFRRRGKWRSLAALAFLILAAVTFAFFLPVLAAGMRVSPDGLTARAWLPTWR